MGFKAIQLSSSGIHLLDSILSVLNEQLSVLENRNKSSPLALSHLDLAFCQLAPFLLLLLSGYRRPMLGIIAVISCKANLCYRGLEPPQPSLAEAMKPNSYWPIPSRKVNLNLFTRDGKEEELNVSLLYCRWWSCDASSRYDGRWHGGFSRCGR